MTTRALQTATFGLLLAFGASGCGSIDNARIDVGGDIPLALENPADRRDEALVEATSRSVTSVARDQWAPRTILLAPDGTQHWPRLTKNGPRYMDHHPRLTGAHPTAASALEIEPDTSKALAEFFAGPIHPAWDVIVAIPRIVQAGIRGEPVASPAIAYQRAAPLDSAPGAPRPELAPIEADDAADDSE